MTPKEADRIIKAGPVTVHNEHTGETFTRTFTSRDSYTIISDRGEKFERGDLIIVKN